MKMIYYFLDYDPKTCTEFDISGPEYKKLIDVCFEYCDHFTLLFKNKNAPCTIKPYKTEVRKPDDICGFYTSEYFERRFFKCTDEAKLFMLNLTKSLFDLVNDGTEKCIPEDPIFYRNNGTAFFWSMTHEGICVLSATGAEDVSSIISVKGWKSYDPQTEGPKAIIPKYFYNQ